MSTIPKTNLMERIVLSNQDKLNDFDNAKKPLANQLLEYLYLKPMINTQFVEDYLHLSTQKANALLQDFINAGIVKEISNSQDNVMVAFSDYLSLFKNPSF